MLKVDQRSSLSDPEVPKLSDADYKEMIQLVLDEVIGNVTSTKLGIGLVNDVQNLKAAIDYPEDKKIVSVNPIK